ncbi:MAG TPA: hypothetical protein VGQ83_17330, partial [Polyangia bacterium]
MDPSKKTMRHYYCRDVLWEAFEQMASSFDCSIDYLINEAMRQYARSQGVVLQGVPGPATGQVGAVPVPAASQPAAPAAPPPAAAPPMARHAAAQAPA